MPRPSLHRLSTFVVAGLLSGALLAVLDLALAPIHPGVSTDDVSGVARAAIVLLLPGAGTVFGLMAALLPGRLALVLPTAAAFYLGDRLAQGSRASELPLAPWWGTILAGLTLAGGLCGDRIVSDRRRAVLAAIPAGLAGLAAYAAAAFGQRGRYEEVRLGVTLVAGCLLFLSIHPLAPARSAKAALVITLIGVSMLAAGAWTAARDPEAAGWATTRGTASAGLALRARSWMTESVTTAEAMELRRAPYFGTPLARESSERLGSVDGVLLITIDALRADVVGTTAGGRPVTPYLDELSSRARVFSRAYTPASFSQLALFGLWSGLYPTQILSAEGGFSAVPLVTERLAAAGVETRSCYAKELFTMRDGGFDRFELGFQRSTLQPWSDLGVDATFEALRPRREGARWLAYVHLMLPHYPYDESAPEYRTGDGTFEMYAAEVRQADDVVRELVARFRRAGLLHRALVIVGSDHGEEFEEHGGTFHGTQVFEEVARVPLMVCGPGVVPGVTDDPVSLVDLPPTLEQLYRLPDAERPPYAGRSLAPALAGLDDPDRLGAVLVETMMLSGNRVLVRDYDAFKSAVVGPRWKLISDARLNRLYLYDLSSDPDERVNLADDEPAIAHRELRRLWGLRRLTGDIDESLFAAADSARQILEAGERLDRVTLFAHLRRRPDIPREETLRHLADFAVDGNPQLVRRLDEAYRGDPDPALRRACLLMRVGALLATDEEVDALVDEWQEIENPHVAAAMLRVFERRRDRRLLGRAARGGELDVRLAAARYRLRFEHTVPERALLEEALASKSAYIRRHAAELAGLARIDGGLDLLLEHLSGEKVPRVRAALVGSAARYDDERVEPLLRREAWRPEGPARGAALFGLLASGRPYRCVHRVSFRDPRQRKHMQGLAPAGKLYGRMADEGAAVPVTVFEQGAVLGVWLSFAHAILDETTVKLSIGDWSTVVSEIPWRPDVPLVADVPPGVAGDTLRVQLVGGAGQEVYFGASLTVGR